MACDLLLGLVALDVALERDLLANGLYRLGVGLVLEGGLDDGLEVGDGGLGQALLDGVLDLLPLGVTRAGLDVLVAWTDRGIVITDDRCPHMAAPFSVGELAGCVVACPLDEGRFDLCTGETVQMPTTGGLDADGNYHPSWSPTGAEPKADPPSKKISARRLTRVNRLRYYPARIRDGLLEAQLPILPE